MAVMHRILTEEPDISGVPESMIPVIADCPYIEQGPEQAGGPPPPPPPPPAACRSP